MRLKKLRNERNMTQEDLSVASGVSCVQIARIESGACDPTVGTLSKIATSLGCGIDDLVSNSAPAMRGEDKGRPIGRRRGWCTTPITPCIYFPEEKNPPMVITIEMAYRDWCKLEKSKQWEDLGIYLDDLHKL